MLIYEDGWKNGKTSGIFIFLESRWTSLVAQLVRNPPAMWETWVQFLGWEDPPGEGKGYPDQCSGLENSQDCIVHGAAKSHTWRSNFHFLWIKMFSGRAGEKSGLPVQILCGTPIEVIAEPGNESPMLFLLIHLPNDFCLNSFLFGWKETY